MALDKRTSVVRLGYTIPGNETKEKRNEAIKHINKRKKLYEESNNVKLEELDSLAVYDDNIKGIKHEMLYFQNYKIIRQEE